MDNDNGDDFEFVQGQHYTLMEIVMNTTNLRSAFSTEKDGTYRPWYVGTVKASDGTLVEYWFASAGEDSWLFSHILPLVTFPLR